MASPECRTGINIMIINPNKTNPKFICILAITYVQQQKELFNFQCGLKHNNVAVTHLSLLKLAQLR